ncbi:hypothetical protein V1L54_00150 [Streptomyces sp. TRM 70361]|uniref:hypothetical protein n=1 Tax=Streptomyces sp. TRM 70361 TaxID=3116553 RepID=UPI002E7B6D20|nr:hypothetical protein [Streptomyces sp. TRM 70361]MEE1937846.1 hypothetical protein [Streptomyces sp. TRM 70361]
MTCDRLVCANCAGPVSEGRCSVCRAHRQRLHQGNGPLSVLSSLSPAALAALLLTLVAVALLARQAAV